MTRTLSITIKENNYQDLKKLIGSRQISKFVNQAVEKELEQKKKELRHLKIFKRLVSMAR